MASVLKPLTAAAPNSSSNSTAQVSRAEASYTPHDQRFKVRSKTFEQQFSHIYQRRLTALRGPVAAAAAAKWGPDVPICDRLVQVRTGETWACIGTLYKNMALKPSVLAEYKDERGISASILVPAGHFTSDDDSLLLEDDSGRMNLRSPVTGAADAAHSSSSSSGGSSSSSSQQDPLPAHTLCTGLVIAVKGVVQPDGDLLVEDWCDAGLPPQPTPPAGATSTAGAMNGASNGASHGTSAGASVLLVSGLLAGGGHDPLATRLFLDHLAGYLGGESDVANVSHVVRVLVCGNSVARPLGANGNSGSSSSSSSGTDKKLTAEQQRELAAPLRECDAELSQIAAAAPVDVMPGSSDPANYALPQQPLHPCLLPLATQYSNLHLVTNPHEAWIGDRLFLGTAGQPLEDMAKYTRPDPDSEGNWPLKTLERMLTWRHVAPTAPDTLGCYPFMEEDPFVLEDCPHVFFAGNQPAYGSSLLQGAQGQQVRVIAVPSFAATGEVVLVNLATLESTPLKFGMSDMPGWGKAGPSEMDVQ